MGLVYLVDGRRAGICLWVDCDRLGYALGAVASGLEVISAQCQNSFGQWVRIGKLAEDGVNFLLFFFQSLTAVSAE